MKKTKKKIVQARIISNRKAATDFFVMKLDSAYLGVNSVPGQFVTVKVAERTTDPLLRIPLGVHKSDKKGISLLYKVVGAGTELLSAKKPGDKISVLGPIGNGFDLVPLLGDKTKEAVIVAGGHGIAPLFFLAETLAKKKKEVTFFAGATTRKQVLCGGPLKKLKLKVNVSTDDGSCGYKGRVTEMLETYLRKQGVKKRDQIVIYGCGPKAMLSALAEVARKCNIPAQVSLDEYIACGVGACLGCAIRTVNGYKLVCKDGPVFNAQEVVWT